MERIAIIVVFWFLLWVKSAAIEFEHIATINLLPIELANTNKYYATEFYTSDKKKIAKKQCFNLYDVVRNKLNSDLKGIVLVVQNNKGDKLELSSYDLDPEIVSIPPVIIYEDVIGIINDTVVIGDLESQKGKVDVEALGKAFESAVVKKYYLQIPSKSIPNSADIFKDGAIIFPQDKTYKRWLNSFRKIEIYRIKD